MRQRTSIDIELRGQPVTIEFHVQGRDPSVGLMGWGFEDESITDANGNVLAWELTEAETDLVTDKVNQMVINAQTDDFGDSTLR